MSALINCDAKPTAAPRRAKSTRPMLHQASRALCATLQQPQILRHPRSAQRNQTQGKMNLDANDNTIRPTQSQFETTASVTNNTTQSKTCYDKLLKHSPCHEKPKGLAPPSAWLPTAQDPRPADQRRPSMFQVSRSSSLHNGFDEPEPP